MVLLEVCVDSLAGLEAALRGAAGRLELCSRLDLDGLSPEPGLVEAAQARARVPLHAMVRPRAGDFVARPGEPEAMLREVEGLRERGLDGVVLGLLSPAGEVDREALARLVAAARPLSVTFHRAFDRVRDPCRALEDLVELGVERVLTSGGAASAFEGRHALRALVEQARARIVVMAGGGVREANHAALLAASGVQELHASVPFATSA